jgi:hypothetical protein
MMKPLRISLALAILLTADAAFALTGTATAPVTPVLTSPANGSTDQPLIITLFWSTSRPGESYSIQVSTNAAFTSTLVDQGGITNATGYTLFGLQKNITHYWRVNASKGSQTSSWSASRSFTTTNATVPVAPSLIAPADDATGVLLDVTFSWNAVAEATAYDFQVAGEPTFSGAHIQWYGYNGTSIQPGADALIEACVIHQYWRVRGRNAAGPGAWSEVRSFTLNSLFQLSATSVGRPPAGDLFEARRYAAGPLLSQNYPNPFRWSTAIEFTVVKDGYATLKVLDATGREVEVLFEGMAEAGVRKRVIFNGERLSGALYFYRLTMPGGGVITKKMLLSKE